MEHLEHIVRDWAGLIGLGFGLVFGALLMELHHRPRTEDELWTELEHRGALEPVEDSHLHVVEELAEVVPIDVFGMVETWRDQCRGPVYA
jgi:hypothetical protein